MKCENPVQFRLKCTTYDIVSDMYNSGKFFSFKDACFHFYNRAKIKKVATGFKMISQQNFYNAFRQFKFKNKLTENNTSNLLDY